MPKLVLLIKSKVMGAPEGFRAGEQHSGLCFGVDYCQGRLVCSVWMVIIIITTVIRLLQGQLLYLPTAARS